MTKTKLIYLLKAQTILQLLLTLNKVRAVKSRVSYGKASLICLKQLGSQDVAAVAVAINFVGGTRQNKTLKIHINVRVGSSYHYAS